MDYYLDIQLLPDPEFAPTVLMNALYNKLHRRFVEIKNSHIGISFPEYQRQPKKLGNVLRLHGSQENLTQLNVQEGLTGMRDHVVVSAIQKVPEHAQYCVVKRRQFKTNAERLRRRRMKRKNESAEQATQAIPSSVERKPDLPFATLRSASTGQTFALFIEQGEPQSHSRAGVFNAYGLSQEATVPYF